MAENMIAHHSTASSACCIVADPFRRILLGKSPISVEPVSCFLGKVIFGHRDRTFKWARKQKCLIAETKRPRRTPAKRERAGTALPFEVCAGAATLEPVSGQVGLCFPGKVILGGRDRTAVTAVEAQCEKSRDQVDPVESANTGYLAPPPEISAGGD
jgi:hypothetical protein